MAKKKLKLLGRNRIIVPAQYGTIERRVRYDDGRYETSVERIVLRQPADLPKAVYEALEYEAFTERFLISPAREDIHKGERVLIPAQYKSITKQRIKKVNRLPPKTAVKLVKFFSKRKVRHEIIKELQDDYQEEQLLEFGVFGANFWYWKEVFSLLIGALLRSPFQKIIPKVD